MTSTSENDAEEAIRKALEAPTLLDAIHSITEWEHTRAIAFFLNTGKRINNFKTLQEQTVRRFQMLDRSIHHIGSHSDVA